MMWLKPGSNEPDDSIIIGQFIDTSTTTTSTMTSTTVVTVTSTTSSTTQSTTLPSCSWIQSCTMNLKVPVSPKPVPKDATLLLG